VKKMSPKFINKVNDSVVNLLWRRESTELKLQRRSSDVIVTHDEMTQKTSLNSADYESSKTKVTFSVVFENQSTQHEMDHDTLDVSHHSCNTDNGD